jgi:hypothetical protein
MRGSDVLLKHSRVRAGKRYAITIKGGSVARVENVIIWGPRGTEGVDIDIGNYNHVQPNRKTPTSDLVNVTREDGKPVLVRVGFASKPVIIGGNCKILFWQSLGLKVYVLFKRLLSVFGK